MSGRAVAVAAALLGPLACAGPPAPGSASDGRYVMGTVLEISVHGPEPARARAVLDELFAVAVRLDRLLSIYLPDSDVSRINAAAGRGPVRVDPDVADVVARSLRLTELTRGSFDVTVGPLLSLWRAAAREGRPPAPAALLAARARVGPALVRVDPAGSVELLREGASLDLGGVAKGYALDRMLPVLRARGVASALLNFGQSSTWAVGAPPEASGWRLLLRGPGDGFLGVLTLRDQALSVSSSLSQSLTIGGRRYGHIVDPRSGRPLQARRMAAVVAPDATLAEALSKALLILPAREGLELVAAQPGCAGLLADAAGATAQTPGWGRSVRFEPLTPASSAAPPAPMHAPWRSRTSPVPSATPTSRSPATSARAIRSSAPSAERPPA